MVFVTVLQQSRIYRHISRGAGGTPKAEGTRGSRATLHNQDPSLVAGRHGAPEVGAVSTRGEKEEAAC